MAVHSNRAGRGSMRDDAAAERLERELEAVEREIAALKRVSTNDRALDLTGQIASLQERAGALQDAIAADPTAWQTVRLARHVERPKIADYIAGLAVDF